MKHVYFITATGTDLGKTWVAAGVAQACRARGVAVRALKPVMSGWDAANPQASDAGVLLAKVGAGDTVESIAPWRFAAPLAPDRAAALEGRSIDFDELVAWCRAEIEASDGLLLIEGIGGVMVPLDARHTVREWIAALGIPVVLVAGSYLGSLSHTLTALAALREAGIVPAVVVLNESADGSVSLDDAAASLAPQLGAIPLLVLRRNDAAGLQGLADFLALGL
jgi:dethiobiotin synthetase